MTDDHGLSQDWLDIQRLRVALARRRARALRLRPYSEPCKMRAVKALGCESASQVVRSIATPRPQRLHQRGTQPGGGLTFGGRECPG